MRGMTPEAKPTVTNRPPRRSDAQSGFGQLAADRVEDHVGAVGQRVAQRGPKRRPTCG